MLIYSETILFPVSNYLFKVNIENTRKQHKIGPKLTKNLPEKGLLQDIPDSDTHSSPCEESKYRDSDAEL